MILTKTAMNELRSHCSKKNGRTFHVTTADNITSEAVVQYPSGQMDVQPASCGAFVRMENDNSRLAGLCQKWGPKNGSYNAAKWGDGIDQARSYDHPAIIGRLIIGVMVKRKDGNAMIILLA